MNNGSVPHELVIIRSDLAVDALHTEGGLVPESDVDYVAEIEEFPAGETDALTIRLDPGTYPLICNISGHYELGMRVGFTVE